MNVAVQLKIGAQHYQAGRLQAALEIYERTLHQFPGHPEALHRLGLALYQLGESEQAVQAIERAVGKEPVNPVYLKNLCAVCQAVGCVQTAIPHLEKALTMRPDVVDWWVALGNQRHLQGDFDNAIQAYEKVLAIDPQHVRAHHDMGVALHAKGAFDRAIVSYRNALVCSPDLPEAMYNMANSLRETGALDRAIDALQNALRLRPGYPDALYNLAKLFKKTGRPEEAIAAYTQLIGIRPQMAEAHNNLGTLLYDQGQIRQAQRCYCEALAILPDYPDALCNLAITCQELGDIETALICSKRALALEPDHGAALCGLAHQKRIACEWEGLNRIDERLDALTRRSLSEKRRPAEGPFLHLSRCMDPSGNLAVAQAWSNEIAGQAMMRRAFTGLAGFDHTQRKSTGRNITLGYLSNNFRDHPLAHLLGRIFGLHDRERFRVHCYSYGKNDGSRYRRQIQVESDRFVDLASIGDCQAASIIYEDGVDILIDLTGYLQGNRLGISALRPAPLQVRYLGLAGTTGADFFDYIIADAVTIPPSCQAHFTENVVHLPHCYQINDRQQPIADRRYTREAFGLPPDAVVFCSFASHYKLDPVMFAAWMRILRAVDPSVLWLIPGSDTAQKNLKQQASNHDVDPDRIVFASRLEKADHLARIGLADLALDTRIVAGAATTSDALWANVPVIAIRGGHFASRMSASILKAIGLPELVCDSLEHYESLAIGLATDSDRLLSIREKLAAERMRAPLFDTANTLKHIETAYELMWRRHTAGNAPQSFAVPAGNYAHGHGRKRIT